MWNVLKIAGIVCTVVGAALTAVSAPFCEQAAIKNAVAEFMAK